MINLTFDTAIGYFLIYFVLIFGTFYVMRFFADVKRFILR